MLEKLRFIIFAVAFVAFAPATGLAAGMVNPNPAPTGFDSNPQSAMESAREHVAAGDMAGALRQLSTYVAAHPTEIGPARLLGDLYYRQGNLAEAENVYREIFKYAPEDRETHNRLGAVYATQNRIDDAIAEYGKSLPGSDSVGNLVDLHKRKGDLAIYKASVERSASLLSSYPDIQDELGEFYWASHDYAHAMIYLNKELDLAPDSLMGLNHAAVNYMDMGMYDRAFEMLERCLRLSPVEYTCTLNLAVANLETRKYDEGKTLLDRAQKLEPEHPEINVNYGYLADARGDWKGAVNDYVKALAISPFSREAYQDLGVTYEQHHLYELAESALLKGLSVSPADGALHYLLGKTYMDQNKPDLALVQFKAAFQSNDPQAADLAKNRISELGGSQTRQPH